MPHCQGCEEEEKPSKLLFQCLVCARYFHPACQQSPPEDSYNWTCRGCLTQEKVNTRLYHDHPSLTSSRSVSQTPSSTASGRSVMAPENTGQQRHFPSLTDCPYPECSAKASALGNIWCEKHKTIFLQQASPSVNRNVPGRPSGPPSVPAPSRASMPQQRPRLLNPNPRGPFTGHASPSVNSNGSSGPSASNSDLAPGLVLEPEQWPRFLNSDPRSYFPGQAASSVNNASSKPPGSPPIQAPSLDTESQQRSQSLNVNPKKMLVPTPIMRRKTAAKLDVSHQLSNPHTNAQPPVVIPPSSPFSLDPRHRPPPTGTGPVSETEPPRKKQRTSPPLLPSIELMYDGLPTVTISPSKETLAQPLGERASPKQTRPSSAQSAQTTQRLERLLGKEPKSGLKKHAKENAPPVRKTVSGVRISFVSGAMQNNVSQKSVSPAIAVSDGSLVTESTCGPEPSTGQARLRTNGDNVNGVQNGVTGSMKQVQKVSTGVTVDGQRLAENGVSTGISRSSQYLGQDGRPNGLKQNDSKQFQNGSPGPVRFIQESQAKRRKTSNTLTAAGQPSPAPPPLVELPPPLTNGHSNVLGSRPNNVAPEACMSYPSTNSCPISNSLEVRADDKLPESNTSFHSANRGSSPNSLGLISRPKPRSSIKLVKPTSVKLAANALNPSSFDYLIYAQEGASTPPPGLRLPARKDIPNASASRQKETASQNDDAPPPDEPLFLPIDPRLHWPQPHSKAWHIAKQQEIEARGRRKQNFGKASHSLRMQRQHQEAMDVTSFEEKLPDRIALNDAWVKVLKKLNGLQEDESEEASPPAPTTNGNGALGGRRVRKLKRTDSSLSASGSYFGGIHDDDQWYGNEDHQINGYHVNGNEPSSRRVSN